MVRCPRCRDLTCTGCDCICRRKVACLNCNRYRLERDHVEAHDGVRPRWVCTDCMDTARAVVSHAVMCGPRLTLVAPAKK